MCGLFGIYNVKKAAELTVIGLHGNQHRAIDYAGIVSSDGVHFYRERGEGIARNVFTADMLNRLHGLAAVGHIRYPTVNDDKTRDNTQPIVGRYNDGPIAIAHNGNLTNRDELEKLIPVSKLATSMDTEDILRLLEEHDTGDIIADLTKVTPVLKGSYAMCILLPDRLLALQDPSLNRPLSIGKLNGGYCVTSETVALAALGATFCFSVDPGTIVTISDSGLETVRFAKPSRKRCRFESIYYSHPGSVLPGEPESVGEFRIRLGAALEERAPVEGADIVTPIPDSANFIAMGYGKSGRSGILMPVIFRSHYAGRTFIAATQAIRDAEVAQKFSFGSEQIRGKSIVVVDDSIVRGTTLPKIVKMLWQLGAREVHVRIGSPPMRFPCMYGINTPTRGELVSANHSPSALCERVGATSLEFLPLAVLKSLSPDPDSYCFSCMTGEYW